MSWTTPFLAFLTIAWFWRLEGKEARLRFLYAATLLLTFYLSWQYLPDFGIVNVAVHAIFDADPIRRNGLMGRQYRRGPVHRQHSCAT